MISPNMNELHKPTPINKQIIKLVDWWNILVIMKRVLIPANAYNPEYGGIEEER